MDPDNRSGLVTLMFTDIEGSTRLWEQMPDRMQSALASHDALLRRIVEAQRGTIVKTVGDGVHAVFDDPLHGVRASLDVQLALADAAVTNDVALRVRCGLHIGVVERRDNDVYGSAVNRAQRIAVAAHGGQILVSRAVATIVEDRLPDGVELRDLGAVWLRDVAAPEQLFQVVHPRLRREFPPPRSLRSNPSNLPQEVTSFVGREREIEDVRNLLARSRVLTLIGTGGIGKTRVAVRVAASVVDRYQDGVWFVDLAAISDPALVSNAVAAVWGLHDDPGTALMHTLIDHARSRSALLVLDNCEHLVGACAKLVVSLISAAPRLTILATSREALSIAGEHIYLLPALSLPPATNDTGALLRSDAARLFIERARLRQPDFEADESRSSLIATICSRLDGIPLALELAAARVGALALDTIARRIENRLGLLTRGDRMALPRQQTLRALLDWSYDLLDPNEKALFARLAVFAGGCTLEAAEAVCADDSLPRDEIVDLVDRLVNKSLLAMIAADDRYRLLETVQEYAGMRLSERGEEAALRERHAAFFMTLAEAAAPAWHSRTDEVKWFPRLTLEHANLKRALQTSLEVPGHPERAMRLCGALGHYWRLRGHWREARDWCDAALARSAVVRDPAVRAKALLTCAMMNASLGERAKAESQVESSLALAREAGNRSLEAGALNNLSAYVSDRGNFDLAHELLAKAQAINHELGNYAWETINLANQGELFTLQGKLEEARETLERALSLSRRTSNRSLEAVTLSRMGRLAERRGELAEARTMAAQALALYRELSAPAQEVEQLHLLATIAVASGDIDAAVRDFGEALERSRDLGYRASILRCLGGIVRLASHLDLWASAARLHGATQSLRTITDARASPSETDQAERMRMQCRVALGDAACEEAFAEGGTLTLDAAVDEALALLAQTARA